MIHISRIFPVSLTLNSIRKFAKKIRDGIRQFIDSTGAATQHEIVNGAWKYAGATVIMLIYSRSRVKDHGVFIPPLTGFECAVGTYRFENEPKCISVCSRQ